MNFENSNKTQTYRMLLFKGKIPERDIKDKLLEIHSINSETVKEKWNFTGLKNNQISNILVYKSMEDPTEIIIILFFEKYYSTRNNTLDSELKNFQKEIGVELTHTEVLNKNRAIEVLQELSSNKYFAETLNHPK